MSNTFNNINNLTMQEGNKKPSCVLRKCCACGKIIDRTQLIRIMQDYKTGNIIINPTNKEFGRSFYICKSEECLKIAQKKKRLKQLSEEDITYLKSLF